MQEPENNNISDSQKVTSPKPDPAPIFRMSVLNLILWSILVSTVFLFLGMIYQNFGPKEEFYTALISTILMGAFFAILITLKHCEKYNPIYLWWLPYVLFAYLMSPAGQITQSAVLQACVIIGFTTWLTVSNFIRGNRTLKLLSLPPLLFLIFLYSIIIFS